MDKLEAIKKAITEFINIQDRYIKQGAADTEPRGNFHTTLEWALAGENRTPRSAKEWDLFCYYDENDDGKKQAKSDAAAEAMTAKCDEIVGLIHSVTIAELDRVRACVEWEADVMRLSHIIKVKISDPQIREQLVDLQQRIQEKLINKEQPLMLQISSNFLSINLGTEGFEIEFDAGDVIQYQLYPGIDIFQKST